MFVNLVLWGECKEGLRATYHRKSDLVGGDVHVGTDDGPRREVHSFAHHVLPEKSLLLFQELCHVTGEVEQALEVFKCWAVLCCCYGGATFTFVVMVCLRYVVHHPHKLRSLLSLVGRTAFLFVFVSH